MGFALTTLIFAVIGIVASFGTRTCFNRGPSKNLDSVLLDDLCEALASLVNNPPKVIRPTITSVNHKTEEGKGAKPDLHDIPAEENIELGKKFVTNWVRVKYCKAFCNTLFPPTNMIVRSVNWHKDGDHTKPKKNKVHYKATNFMHEDKAIETMPWLSNPATLVMASTGFISGPSKLSLMANFDMLKHFLPAVQFFRSSEGGKYIDRKVHKFVSLYNEMKRRTRKQSEILT
ncbi:hypothetical protein V2J09_024307 [Rumex salicifolius]